MIQKKNILKKRYLILVYLSKVTDTNIKMKKIENKIRSIAGLVTTIVLDTKKVAVLDNKIPDISCLV